eukprot:3040691-Rhodomonas_salina.1
MTRRSRTTKATAPSATSCSVSTAAMVQFLCRFVPHSTDARGVLYGAVCTAERVRGECVGAVEGCAQGASGPGDDDDGARGGGGDDDDDDDDDEGVW